MVELENEKLTEGNDWRGELHLARVESAGMGKLTQLINDGNLADAWKLAKLMRYLSIV